MKFLRLIILLITCITIEERADCEIIASSNRVDWIPGVTVGVQKEFSPRTNLINASKPPYNADTTGNQDAKNAIQSAIDAASSGDVVYLPAGRYRVDSTVCLNKDNITIRGEGKKTILIGCKASGAVLIIGHDPLSNEQAAEHSVIGGGLRGQTNFVLNSVLNGISGTPYVPGDSLTIRNKNAGNETFPVISVLGYDNLISQSVVVHSVRGNTINITSPLYWDFTNSAIVKETGSFSPTYRPRVGIGVENLSITLTNAGQSGSSIYMINASMLKDCWFTNLDLGFAHNYQMGLSYAVNCTVSGNTIHDALTIGSSHAGLLMSQTSGCLIENNIFSSGAIQLFPAIEFNGGVVGCAFAFNYFTNNALDIDCHNSHPLMNLFEGNVCNTGFKMDGYYGSASHQTLFRNFLNNTTGFKRWTSYMQVVGNIMGNTNFSYIYEKEQSLYGSPYPIFELGYPNIGNNSFVGVSPPVPWNFPGTNYVWTDNASTVSCPNGTFTFANDQGPTNTLMGDFSKIPRALGGNYAIVFQDNLNTNLYHGGGIMAPLGGTSSNLVLNTVVSVKKGWTLYVVGPGMYQQLQSNDKYTHTIHGNLTYTDPSGTIVWNPQIIDRNIPLSLLYTNGAPKWWGTTRWPAMGPDMNPVRIMIPAEAKYLGISVSEMPASPSRLSLKPN